MKLAEAEQLAHELMQQHGISPPYRFHFDRAVNRFGQHHGGKRTISLSRTLTSLNDEAVVRDTILHEIAHALASLRHGRNCNHNDIWKAIACEIGAKPLTCSDAPLLAPPKWTATCVNCGKVYRYQRRRGYPWQLACRPCCQKMNKGKFSERFILIWERQLPDFV